MWMVFDEFERLKADGKKGCVWGVSFKLLILFDANVTGFIVFCIIYQINHPTLLLINKRVNGLIK